jgi:nucleotide-binding universal stress UspA family protein
MLRATFGPVVEAAGGAAGHAGTAGAAEDAGAPGAADAPLSSALQPPPPPPQRTHPQVLAHLILAPADEPAVIAGIIAGKARELHASLIVASHHARSALAEWWLGSVTRALLHASHVPVALVPPAPPAERASTPQ